MAQKLKWHVHNVYYFIVDDFLGFFSPRQRVIITI
jgi:hypothetical protein